MAGEQENESGQAGNGGGGRVFPDHRLKLAKLVKDRREELHVTWKEIATRAEAGESTVREMARPTRQREFGYELLGKVSKALEWSPDHLAKKAYQPSEATDEIVQGMMTALTPYLEKIDKLQQDVAEIKAGLSIRPDVVHPVE